MTLHRILIIAVTSLGLGVSVAHANLVPLQLVPGETGLGVFYSSDGVLAPEQWGQLRASSDGGGVGHVVSGGFVESDGPNAFLDYDPTLDTDQGTTVNIPGTGDWAFTLDWEVVNYAASTRVFEMGSQLNDIARVVSTGTANEYLLTAGNGSGSYSDIGTFTTSVGGFHSIYLFHDGTDNLFDLYVDDVLEFSDFRARVDTAPVEFRTVRVHGSTTLGVNRYDNIMASASFIPEPGTLAMLLIGGGLLSIARRFRT